MKKLVHSLMFKILLLCMGLVLAVSASIHYFAYKAAETSVEQTLGQMAVNITSSVLDTIDAAKLEQFEASLDINDEYYSELKKEFIDIRHKTGLKYLYAMSKTKNDEYIYVVEGTEAGGEGESLPGDVEKDISTKMLEAFQGYYTYEFYDSEEWGELISGYVPIKNSAGEVIGMLGADFDASYMIKQLGKANIRMFTAEAFVFLGSILLALFVSSLLIRSLKKMQAKIEIIKHGDLTVRVATSHKDEIGGLSQAFQLMIDNMSGLIHNIREKSNQVLLGVDSLNSSVDVTNRTTEEITKVVGEIAVGAAAQVDNVEVVEESMNRVFTEIVHITENIELTRSDSDTCINQMKEASEKLNHSVEQINLVNNTVDSTALLMKQLEDKFKEVLSFSEIIAAISKQTNLLALNASIEAASAGEHGKGFAVVASEIKELAKQSSDASKKINELITAVKQEIDHSSNAIQSGVVEARNGVSVMTEVKEYLDKLSGTNQKINTRIKEIATAVNHIEDDGRNVMEKTASLSVIAKDFNSGTQQTSAETEEQYAIMEGIKNELQSLKGMMETLGGTVNQFKVD